MVRTPRNKRERICELALCGYSNAQIRAILNAERPGTKTWPSEVSFAIAPLVRKGALRSRNRARPVEVEGIRYASVAEASRAHGISAEAGRKRLLNDHIDWDYIDERADLTIGPSEDRGGKH